MKKKELGNIENGFKVPDGYFSEFEERMITRLGRTESENSLLPGKNPFEVPEGYFAHFEERVTKLFHEKEEVKVIPLFRRKAFSYVASVAAVLLVIFTSIVLNSGNELSFNDIDVLTMENYLLESLDMRNPEETLLLSDQDDIIATSMDPIIDNDAVLEYLKENVDEPAILLNDE